MQNIVLLLLFFCPSIFAKTCSEVLVSLEDQSRAWQAQRIKHNFAKPLRSQLRIATINLNLVHGIFVRNPIYIKNNQRVLDGLRTYLTSPNSPDILSAQEIWERADHHAVLKLADEAGYEPAVNDDMQMTQTGLQTLIKKSVLGSGTNHEFKAFLTSKNKGVRTGWEKIGRKQRGVLISEFKLKDGTSVRFKNTHFTPLNCHGRVREQQIEAMKEMSENSQKFELEILLGDLNIAADGVKNDYQIYQSLSGRLGLIDSYRTVNSDFGGTVNRAFPQTIALRFGKLIDRRIDYILIGEDAPMNIQVEKAQVIFNDHYLNSISDHFGVETVLNFY